MEGEHGGIFIGDVRLSDLKQALTSQDIACEFRAGALVCGGGVVVRVGQEREGELAIEGSLSADYYKIRDVVYGQYNIC